MTDTEQSRLFDEPPGDAEPSEDVEPEAEAKHELTTWLREHGLTVFWEQSNVYGYPTFSVEGRGTAEKPDLLVAGDRLTVAIEMKDGSSKSNVYDASPQTHRYWLQSPTVRYVARGREFTPDGVLTATQYSLDGHLFHPTVDTRLDPEGYGSGRKRAISIDELPQFEHAMTEQYVRTLWRYAKELSSESNIGIGALLSTVLDGDDHREPAALWTLGKRQGWEVVR